MFERFTPSARAIVADTQVHARRLGHRFIGTEHLLLALCASEEPVGALFRSFGLTTDAVANDIGRLLVAPIEQDRAALATLGIDLDRVLAAVESSHGPGALDLDRHGDSVGARLVRRRRVSLRRWRRHRSRTCCEPRHDGHIHFSGRAKKCLELSLREALRLHHNFIAPEHIALGVLREGQGLACSILVNRSVPFGTLQAAVEHSLRESA